MTKLSPQEDLLLTFMQSVGYGVDVSIDRMYEATMGQGRGNMPLRKAQMHLGAVVSRVNKKTTTGEKIIPGDLKHTYRLKLSA